MNQSSVLELIKDCFLRYRSPTDAAVHLCRSAAVLPMVHVRLFTCWEGGGGGAFVVNILLKIGSALKSSERPLSHRAYPGISTGSNGLKFCGVEMDGTSGKCQRLKGLTV